MQRSIPQPFHSLIFDEDIGQAGLQEFDLAAVITKPVTQENKPCSHRPDPALRAPY